jgi:hypothetical protein
MSTGPFAALKTLVETLPSLARCIGPSPRLPTANNIRSPSSLSSAASSSLAAGSPTSIRTLGRAPRSSHISAARSSSLLSSRRSSSSTIRASTVRPSRSISGSFG